MHVFINICKEDIRMLITINTTVQSNIQNPINEWCIFNTLLIYVLIIFGNKNYYEHKIKVYALSIEAVYSCNVYIAVG